MRGRDVATSSRLALAARDGAGLLNAPRQVLEQLRVHRLYSYRGTAHIILNVRQEHLDSASVARRNRVDSIDIESNILDTRSKMEEDATTTAAIEQAIAARVRALRAERGLSLDALAARSGVSRSMISLVERGEASPTAALLAKLATGLGVVLSALFEVAAGAGRGSAPLARRDAQPVWRDPDSGYRRRNVSPDGAGQPMQIVEVDLPAGARVAFDNGLHGGPVIHQQVWLLEGALEVTAGQARHRLDPGDCLAMQLDQPTMFHNPTRGSARYVVVTAPESGSRR